MFVCGVFLLSAQKNTANYSKKLFEVEKELEKVLQGQQIAGFSVAVVHKDKVLFSKGFGYRDLENKKPVTPNTLFAIGSSTKAFTAAILGQLEKEGKLKLDDLATSHLPQLKFKYDHMNSNITIRDMMCHRTGLSRFDYSWYLFNSTNRDSLIQRIQYFEPNAKLREKWQYNNWMFLAQGMISERITEITWEQNINDRFFVPLNMARSTTSIEQMQKDADASLPYSYDNELKPIQVPYYKISGMGPAGSINSSANDMANWVSTWIMGGKFEGREILPASYVKAASSSQMVVSSGFPDEHADIQFSNYGLGWFLESYRGHYMVEHGGNIDGFSTSVAFFPSDSIGIVVMVNQNGSSAPSIIRNIIADKLFDLPVIPWRENGKKEVEQRKKILKDKDQLADSSQVKGTQPSHPLKDYSGIFTNPAYHQFEITLTKDTLRTFMMNKHFWLKHVHYDIFSLESSSDSEQKSSNSSFLINFGTSNQGKIDRIYLELDEPGKTTEFKRENPTVVISENELKKYIGEYELSGQTITIFQKDNLLMVLVPGQPEYETKSIGNDTFELTIAKGFSVQFTVENGKAIAVTFIQPNGTFKAVRK